MQDFLQNSRIAELAEVLTDEQKIAFIKLLDWYFNDDQPYHILSGSAGCGKSFLVGRLLKAILYYKPLTKIAVCAPTNKATGVLNDVLMSENLSIHSATLHSILHLRIGNKYDDAGNRLLEINHAAKTPHISDFNVDVIDEISMIPSDLLGFINAGKGRRTKILLSGDKYQLPPVENDTEHTDDKTAMQVSPVYKQGIAEVILRKPVRYSGAIAQYAATLRLHIEHELLLQTVKDFTTGTKFLETFKQNNFDPENPLNADFIADIQNMITWDPTLATEGVKESLDQLAKKYTNHSVPNPIHGDNLVLLDKDDWENKLLDYAKKDPRNVRAIAWTNIRVNELSKRLRVNIHGDTEYHVGDRLMAKESIVLESSDPDGKPYTFLNTCQECVVTSINITTPMLINNDINSEVLKLPLVELTVVNDFGVSETLTTVQSTDLKTIGNYLKKIRKDITDYDDVSGTHNKSKAQQWKSYYELMSKLNITAKKTTYIHRLEYAGALTVNSGQGSGYPVIFVDLLNIRGCQNMPHKLRLIYTAITRAKAKCYLLTGTGKYIKAAKPAIVEDDELNQWLI